MTASPERVPPVQSAATLSGLPAATGLPPAPGYALYPPNAATLATFLGGPIAGTVVLAKNYYRLGRPSAGRQALLWGVLATAALIGLGFALAGRSPGMLLALVPVVVVAQLAKTLQGEAFERHKQAGGPVASMWKAAGIGLVTLAGVFAVIAVAVVATTMLTGPSTLKVGSSEVLYSGNATTADAQALGKSLTDLGYFRDEHPATVLLSKDASGTTLKFVVNEAAADNETTLAIFAAITEKLAPSIGGKPITLQLVNKELKELKSKRVE
jgi:hypothetical protein